MDKRRKLHWKGARRLAKQTLSRRRYQHTVQVAHAAARLAWENGESVSAARLAAYPHDIAKELPPDRLRALAAHPDINGVIDQPSALPVLHAFAGAAVAESLGVSDPDVLSAIRYHTTARRGMSRLEKIIFVADYIGYDRRFPEAAAVRRAARRSLDEACGMELAFTRDRLLQKGKTIVPLTLEAIAEFE